MYYENTANQNEQSEESQGCIPFSLIGLSPLVNPSSYRSHTNPLLDDRVAERSAVRVSSVSTPPFHHLEISF